MYWFSLFVCQSDLKTFVKEEGNLGHQVTPRARVWRSLCSSCWTRCLWKMLAHPGWWQCGQKGQEFFEDENLSALWSCRNHQAAGTPSKQGLRGRRKEIYLPLASVAEFFIKKRSLLLVWKHQWIPFHFVLQNYVAWKSFRNFFTCGGLA